MATALRSWPFLRHLNLSDCVLSDEGSSVSPVLEVLAGGSNPKLETLLLQNNNLETQSYALLAEGLEVHLPMLKMLEVQWNEIEEDDEGIAVLLRLMKKRGGKIILDDEEEEEEEEEEKDEEEEAKATEVGKPSKKDAADEETDELADLLGKVQIKS